MDAAAELGRNPLLSKHQIQPEYEDEQADAGRNCRTVSRDQILRRERGQGNIRFPCSADHNQDSLPYPVDPYSYAICVAIQRGLQYHDIRNLYFGIAKTLQHMLFVCLE